MSIATRRTWETRIYWAIVILGVVLGLSAIARDYQTRQLIDKPAREAAQKICVSANARWSAYLTAVTQIANERADNETMEAYEQRKARTEKIVEEIRKVVTVNCVGAFN